ncbi:MAG: glycosyltransferase, partial [Acidimicrobiaceae bacterium]|nr:glycosyltransferase [Acidimicrobiaceae bacterium]
PSGENRVVDTESAALCAAGHEVARFERCSDDIAGWSAARKATLPVTAVWDRSARTDLSTVLARNRPDVVHVHNTFPLLSPSVLAACADAGVPAVVTFHNYRLACANGTFFRAGTGCHDCVGGFGLPALRHGCYRGSTLHTTPIVLGNALQRRAWRTLPSAYVFISEAERRAMESLRFPPERQFVKWNMVPAPPLGPSTRSAQVVFLGRLDQVKGLPLLMEAWDRFRSTLSREKLRLVIAGAGPMEGQVRAWAARHEDVDVAGLLDRDSCRALALASTVAVIPSAWEETFGLVAVEAMSNGLAVVGANIGALTELLDTGRFGALFTAGDAGALAALLADIAAVPQRWRQMGREARRVYEERFDPSDNLDELLGIYRFAVDNPVHRQPA